MSINYLNKELEGRKFQAGEYTACADNSRQGRTQWAAGIKKSLMWPEEKGHKRRLARARIVSLLKRIRFYWSTMTLLRNFRQENVMITLAFLVFLKITKAAL